MVYLLSDQIDALLAELDSRESGAVLIAKVCLATGARWGKAEGLQARQVRDGMVHYFKTKSSKNRSVPISRKLAAQVAEALPFKSGCNKFRQAVEAIGLEPPEG